MSDPAFAGRRGVLANAVAEKALLSRPRRDRSILFFVQALSMQLGGLPGLARDLIKVFPERINCDLVPACSLDEFAAYLNGRQSKNREERAATAIAKFLEELCINPALNITTIRELKSSSAAPFLRDPIGTLEEFRKRRIRRFERQTVKTSIGEQIHELLDFSLSTGRMVVMIGESGAGKTFAAEDWCFRHCDDAVFVTLSGITHRTGFFTKISHAVGLAHSQHSSSKKQARVESYFASTRRMLVIDEAHYLWPQHQRSHSSPELIDWINTALVNNRVPVALIATPQFARHKARCEREVGWNGNQLVHRTARFHVLNSAPTKDDLRRVAQNLLSHRWNDELNEWTYEADAKPDEDLVDLITVYGDHSVLSLAVMRSIIDDAQRRAQLASRRQVSVADVKLAYNAQKLSDGRIRDVFFRAAQPPRRTNSRRSLSNSSEEQMSNFRLNSVAALNI